MFGIKRDPVIEAWHKMIKTKLKRREIRAYVYVPCVSGLPVPGDFFCPVFYLDDRIEINTMDAEYIIPIEQIQNISIERELYETSEWVSNAEGVLKKKNTVGSHLYLIIDYIQRDGEPAQVIFNVTYDYRAKKMRKLFRKQYPERAAGPPSSPPPPPPPTIIL